jgi:deoxyribonuclease V
VRCQELLAGEAAAAWAASPFTPPPEPLVGGCFVAFARGEAGPGHPGDRAWAAAVAWRPHEKTPGPGRRERQRRPGIGAVPMRSADQALRGSRRDGPRRAADVADQAVAFGRVPAAYTPGLLARREGPILAAAVGGLEIIPDVLLVDATGTDHPRGAGLALHLGAVTGIPTVGVTQHPLVADRGEPPPLVRGATSPVRLAGRTVGYWVCTRTGARPVLAHAGWRTDAETAVAVALVASTEGARTPVPLQEARRVAREARAVAGAGLVDQSRCARPMSGL